MQVATACGIRFLVWWNFKHVFMALAQFKVIYQYLYWCNSCSLKTTICYRCFLKGFQSRKDFWGIANDVWTNYSVVCTPMRHNLEQSQTCSRSPSMWNLNEPLRFSSMWVGGSTFAVKKIKPVYLYAVDLCDLVTYIVFISSVLHFQHCCNILKAAISLW